LFFQRLVFPRSSRFHRSACISLYLFGDSFKFWQQDSEVPGLREQAAACAKPQSQRVASPADSDDYMTASSEMVTVHRGAGAVACYIYVYRFLGVGGFDSVYP
jgi:hypothetical protein